MTNIMSQAIKKLDHIVTRMHDWETSFSMIEDRLSLVEQHLKLVPTVTDSTGEEIPIQSTIYRSPTKQPTPKRQVNSVNTTSTSLPVTNNNNNNATASTSSSTVSYNNTNTPPTMQNLSSEFDDMKGEVNSLKDMMASLGNMLQNLGAQQTSTNNHSQ